MAEPKEPLTERELEIIRLLATGAANKEIAVQLYLSPNTVKVHLRNIFTKLEVQTRTEATMIAVRNGWVAIGAISPDPVAPAENPPTVTAEGELSGELVVASPPTPRSIEAIEAPKPIAVAPNPQLLPLLPLRRRLVLVGAGVAGVLLLAATVATPTPRIASTGGPAGPRIVGGENPVGPLPNNSLWHRRASIQTARMHSAAGAVQNKIYITGGDVNDEVLAETVVYTPGSNQWTEAAPKPTPITDAPGIGLGSNFYVPGGITADQTPTDRFEALDSATGVWTALPPMPVALSGHTAAAMDNVIYVFGGSDVGGVSNIALAYDVAQKRWESIPALPTPRTQAAAVALNNRIYVVGGADGQRELDTCEVYVPAERKWNSCKPMNFGRSSFGLARVGNSVYAIGGGGPDNYIALNERYDTANDQWSTFDTPGANIENWTGTAVVSLQTEFYVIGGTTRGVPLADNYVYEVFSNKSFIPAIQANGGN